MHPVQKFGVVCLVIIAFWWLFAVSCMKPTYMSAQHTVDIPQAPESTQVCKMAPALVPEDSKDKLIRQQEVLLTLYEQRIAELERQLKEAKP